MIIRLDLLGGTAQKSLTCKRDPIAGSATCVIGTGADSDLQLPRPEYGDLGRKELQVSLRAGELRLEHFQARNQLLVNGQAFPGGVLVPGVHTLRLNAHELRLTVELSGGG